MKQIKNLTNVSENEFTLFVNKYAISTEPGEVFHSLNFLDRDRNIIAYEETSSYGTKPIYKILINLM